MSKPVQQPIELKRLSDTRWNCQDVACNAVIKTLPDVCLTLEDIIYGANAERAIEARSVNGLLDLAFVVTLVTMTELLSVTKSLSDHLQSPRLQLASANDLVHTVIDDLRERRNEQAFSKIWNKSKAMCEEAGIEEKPKPKRRRKKPATLDQYVVESQHGHRDALLTEEDFRIHVYYKVIDELSGEIERRFSGDVAAVLEGSSALNPSDSTFLQQTHLDKMARHYGVRKENLQAELHQVKRTLARKKQKGITVSTPMQFLEVMTPYRDAFMDVYKLLCISIALPVSSASCERSFSRLKLIKSPLRSRSTTERTSDIACISINTHRARRLNVESLIDAFAANHDNRRIVLQ